MTVAFINQLYAFGRYQVRSPLLDSGRCTGSYLLQEDTLLKQPLPARVMLLMQFIQPLPRYVGIDLGGRQIAMSKQHLHHAQIGTMI